MVTFRPHTATFTWKSGYTYAEGKMTGGTTSTMIRPCRVEHGGVNDIIVQDGKQVQVSLKLFCDSYSGFSAVDEATLKVTALGREYKVLKLLQKQTHVRVWL